MKVDINDSEYLEELAKAVNSPQGQIINEFIKYKIDEIAYDHIEINKSYQEIGQSFVVIRAIKEKLETIFKFLTRRYN